MSDIERRQDRLDDALERLANVSMDLKQIVAVLEQRITQNEKDTTTLFKLAESRRTEFDNKVKEYGDKLDKLEKELTDEIESFKKEFKDQCSKNSHKISQLERFIWMAIGGGIAVSTIVSYLFRAGLKFM